MAYLEIRNLTKKFGDFTAVHDVTLDVERGEMIALLGGSGCGKTTILRMIAGFTAPFSGSIAIDGKSMAGIPAHKRNVGISFQNYALFPHMTVFDNVAFSLKLQKLPREQISAKVNGMLELVRLTGMEKRFPRELSGGQQQRVALARALVMEPALLLLDEPLSNLDAKLRVEMQVEIKRIQRELGVTTIIVTHDHEEAVSLADRVVVMNAGHIMQIGTPDGVFDYPENPYVADFMGFTNLFDGTVAAVDGETVTVTDANGNQFRAHDRFHTGFAAGDAVQLAIRPDNILPADGPGENVVTGTIQNVTYKGVVSRIDVEGVLKDALLHINIHNYDSGKAGARMDAKLPADKLLIYKN